MRLVVNGKERTLEGVPTVEELLDELRIDRRGTAVVRGGQVVPRDSYATTALEEGEHLEIVRMVGGG